MRFQPPVVRMGQNRMAEKTDNSAGTQTLDGITDSYQVFSVEIAGQTDRGMAIIAAAYLEDELENTIKSHLVANDKETESLFEYPGPLASFDAKSRLAYAIGIIGPRILKDLNYIRKIRNQFAHWPLAPTGKRVKASVTFATQPISAWCKNLEYPDAYPQVHWQAWFRRIRRQNKAKTRRRRKGDYIERLPPFIEPKKRFLHTVAALQWVIFVAARMREQLPIDYGQDQMLGIPNPGFMGFRKWS